jgi:hypothetical protein
VLGLMPHPENLIEGAWRHDGRALFEGVLGVAGVTGRAAFPTASAAFGRCGHASRQSLLARFRLPPASRKPSAPPMPAAPARAPSLRVMEQVSIAAHKCWFASKDPAFRSYRFANELNSMSGQPRFLLVPAKNFGGLPALVVQARGGSSQVEAFGPADVRAARRAHHRRHQPLAHGRPESCGSAA